MSDSNTGEDFRVMLMYGFKDYNLERRISYARKYIALEV
jgi:hypothetical protein